MYVHTTLPKTFSWYKMPKGEGEWRGGGRGEAHDNPMMASKQTKQTNTSLINIYRFPNFKVLLIWTLAQLFIHHSEMRKIKVCFKRSCFLSWWIYCWTFGVWVPSYYCECVTQLCNEWMNEWVNQGLFGPRSCLPKMYKSIIVCYLLLLLLDWLIAHKSWECLSFIAWENESIIWLGL